MISWTDQPDANPNRPEGLLGRPEGEGEEEDATRNCDDQSGTLVLEDTDTGQSIGSSRREYLLCEKGKGRVVLWDD